MGPQQAAEAREVFPLLIKFRGTGLLKRVLCAHLGGGSEPVVVVVYSTRGGSSDGPGLAATGACLLYSLRTMSGRSTARASQAQTPLPAPATRNPSFPGSAPLTSTKVFCILAACT